MILFCFDTHSGTLLAVVKTVREPADNESVIEGRNHLLSWLDLLQTSPFTDNFPKDLGIYYVDGIAFSIETALRGRRIPLRDIGNALDQYAKVEHHILKKATSFFNVQEETLRLLLHCAASETESALIRSTHKRCHTQHNLTPTTPQHGDLTPTNILWDQGQLRVIDCEHATTINVPGYDAFHLLSRNKKLKSGAITAYMDRYFRTAEIPTPYCQCYAILYLCQEYALKMQYLQHKQITLGSFLRNRLNDIA